MVVSIPVLLLSAGTAAARDVRFTAGPKSGIPEPEIAFAWPTFVSTAGGRAYVCDATNQRVTVVRFEHAAVAECPLP